MRVLCGKCTVVVNPVRLSVTHWVHDQSGRLGGSVQNPISLNTNHYILAATLGFPGSS